VLDIIHRLPQSDPLKTHALDLMETMMILLRQDNEDNATFALKIVMELFKTFKGVLESQVEPFFILVHEMYGHLEQGIHDCFDSPDAPEVNVFQINIMLVCSPYLSTQIGRRS
jgi:transformation/transcription domain-associated protein